MLPRDFDPVLFLASFLVIVLSLSLHEFAHAKFADLAGDPTPRIQGRVTLNPLKHLDPFGTLALLLSSLSGVGFGWGRPVQVDPRKMRNPKWDHFTSVLAGPVSNLVLAIIFAAIMRFTQFGTSFSGMLGGGAEIVPAILFMGVVINIGLFAFNLIPLGPLDGHWLVGAFLPDRARDRWYHWNRTTGSIVLLVLIFMPAFTGFSVIGRVLRPVAEALFALLTGIRI